MITKSDITSFSKDFNLQITILRISSVFGFGQNENLKLNLGKNARKTIAYSFSWERSINKIKRILLEEFYREQ